VGEYESGIIATIPILAALRWQRKTGKGQYIDCSQQEMLMQLDAAELVRYPNEGLAATRGTRGYNVGGVMPCKDGYLEFTMLEEHQWQALVRLMDHPEWANDPRFKERASRETHGKELNDLVKKWLADYTKEDTYHRGQAEGCTVAPYNTVDEVLRSNQMKARSFFVEIEHAQTGQFKYATAPYKYSATPLAIVRPAPTLGEHNEEIYCQRLGCSQQDIIKLRETGAI
jgi:crotonobetainyl-CoA:carnitine CoA-transferase CaiB-like acyl-CoA transferase